MAPHSRTLAWKNPMDGGAWWAAVHGVAQSRTRLKQFSSSSNSSRVNGRMVSLPHCPTYITEKLIAKTAQNRFLTFLFWFSLYRD